MADTLKPESAVFYSTNRGWPWGAPDYVLPKMATRLLKNSIPVVVVTHPDNLQRSEILDLQAKGAHCLPLPVLQIPGGRLEKWRRWCRQRQPDLKKLHRTIRPLPRPHFFINQGGDFDFADEPDLLPYLDQADNSFDIIIHSTQSAPPLSESQRQIIRHYFRKANRVCFNSEWSRSLVEIKLLEHFENAEVFSYLIKCPIRRLPWPEDESARLACVNRIDVHHKGLDTLLLACRDLKNSKTGWTLDIFGDGPDKEYLKQMIRWLGMENCVSLHPYEPDIEKIWSTHHMLLLTSRYEGFGVSMLEAMACGRPVLRTPYGGAEQWIRDGENGFICPAPEPELIRQSLERALSQFVDWENLGNTAHHDILTTPQPHPESIFLNPFGLTS